MLTNEKQQQFNSLKNYSDQVEHCVLQMQKILKEHFPDQYSEAYQHWIPQILTGVKSYDKWLPRGCCSVENTLLKILDNNNGTGIKKIV